MIADAVRGCRQAGLECGLFHEVKGNPTGRNVDDGVARYREGRHDGVIAFGGGSALDAAKAIALMAGQKRPLWDFEDVGDNYLRVNVAGMAPVVAVPTTAGTGSEVGRASVITDEAAQVKRIIFHARMLPAIVILDPELTVGLPPRITAATGMDALSHNLEAYCSPFFHPMAAGIALEGMRMIKEYLPRAVADGADLQARQQMLVASSMGATAFQRGLGAMHALAHPLGRCTTPIMACSTPSSCPTCSRPTSTRSRRGCRRWRATWRCRTTVPAPCSTGSWRCARPSASRTPWPTSASTTRKPSG